MADREGKVLRTDAEAVIYQYFMCSDTALRRYIRTLKGARIIEENSSYLIVTEKQK
jgi:hypothetical protein